MKLLTTGLLLLSFVTYGQNDKTEVEQLHRKKFTWLTSKNYDSLDLFLHDELQYVHSNGWVQSKKDVLEDLKSGKLNYTQIDIVEASTARFGNTAVVSGKGHFRGLMPDKSQFNLSLFYTEVYIKSGKRWKLVNRLSTKITL